MTTIMTQAPYIASQIVLFYLVSFVLNILKCEPEQLEMTQSCSFDHLQ